MTVIPHEAMAYIETKGLKTSYNWSEIYAKEHSHAFTVAKIMEMDVLDSIHQAVTKAIAEGQSFHTFKKNILTTLGKSGWGNYEQIDEKTGDKITRLSNSRLKKVYLTNKTQSYHAGTWQRFQKNKKTHPFLRYRLGPSKEHRLEHSDLENIVLPVDHPFWRTHFPMNGWGCLCWLENLTEEQALALGISPDPEVIFEKWVNKSTGRIHMVPKGIDPGFEYNVGMHREHKALQLVTDKLTQVVSHNPELANATMIELLNDTAQQAMISKVVNELVNDIASTKRAYGNTLAIGVINDDIINQLQTLNKAPHHKIIALSDTQILHAVRDSKQDNGRGLPLQFWQNLPERLQNPDAVLLDPQVPGSKKTSLDTLIFVYKTEHGRVMIKLDYESKIKINDKKERIKLNMVTTGGVIADLTSLGRYQLLYGSL